MNEQVKLNGVEVWAYIVETESGIRMRLSLDDWDRCRLYRAERIPLRRHGRPVVWFFLAEAVEMPPIAWFNLESRVRVEV